MRIKTHIAGLVFSGLFIGIPAVGIPVGLYYLIDMRNRPYMEEKAEKSKEDHSRELLKKYDINGNGALEGEELRNLSRDLYLSQYGWEPRVLQD